MLRKARRHEGTKTRRRGGAKARRLAASRRRARGFTLVELIIAVAVLVVIIIATSKIFSTAAKVTGLGQATADVLQETTAIERQIRNDFERLAPEGVFAIRCVAVRNDINFPGPLLNPALPDEAMIRADQLLFFTNGVQSIQTFRQGSGSNHKGQATAARVYYGHAFQLPEADEVDTNPPDYVLAHDPLVIPGNPLVPWYSGTYGMIRTVFRSDEGGTPPDYFIQSGIGSTEATQPVAPQWLLARQVVLLADDGGNEVVFLGNNRSARSIFTVDPVIGLTPEVRNGRVDAAATQLNDIRTAIVGDGTVPWIPDQRDFISSELLFYPRAERVAPGMHRVDQALTNNVLATACSSFIVEWTYEDGVGFALAPGGPPHYEGFDVDPRSEQPWFGMPDPVEFLENGNILPDPSRGVGMYGDSNYRFDLLYQLADTIHPDNVERIYLPLGPDVAVYEAFFGYNRDTPLDPATDLPWDTYSPWPSAIRITMVLHDPATKLEVGREVQFVINLPKRVQ